MITILQRLAKKPFRSVLLTTVLLTSVTTTTAFPEAASFSVPQKIEVSIPVSTRDISPSEQIKLKKHSEHEKISVAIEKNTESYELGYAGFYFDNDSNLVVQVTNNKNVEKIKELNKIPDDVKFEEVKWSKKELQDVKDTLTTALNNKSIPGLAGTGIDFKKNKVTVFVKDFSVQNLIEQFVNPEMINIYKIELVEDQVRSGDLLLTTSAYTCTAAFHGIKSSTNVTITAGHCSNAPGGTGSWKFGSATIGSWGGRS